MSVTRIGIAGEDSTDCETLEIILRRMMPQGIGIKKRAPTSGGCASLRRKARAHFKTNMNRELAQHLDLSICAERCPSFEALHAFVRSNV